MRPGYAADEDAVKGVIGVGRTSQTQCGFCRGPPVSRSRISTRTRREAFGCAAVGDEDVDLVAVHSIAPGATIFCNNANSGDTNSCLITGVVTKP